MKRLFKNYLIEGLLLIALGVVMLIWPAETRGVLITVIGALIALAGLMRVIAFFVDKIGMFNGFDIVIGLLQIAAGVFMLVKPSCFMDMFPVVIGVILLYGALALFVFSIRWRRGFRCLLGVIFAILLAAVAVVYIVNPAAFSDFITKLHGIALICEGLILVIFMSKALLKE